MLADLQHPSYRPLDSTGVFFQYYNHRFYFYLSDCGDFMKTWLEVKFKSIMEHFASRCILLYSNVKHGFGKNLNKPNSSPHPPPPKTPKLGDLFKGKRIFYFNERCKRLRVFFAAILAIVVKVAILKERAFIKLISVLVTFRVVSKPKFRFQGG